MNKPPESPIMLITTQHPEYRARFLTSNGIGTCTLTVEKYDKVSAKWYIIDSKDFDYQVALTETTYNKPKKLEFEAYFHSPSVFQTAKPVANELQTILHKWVKVEITEVKNETTHRNDDGGFS